MSDLILNAMRRKSAQATQIGDDDLAKRLDAQIADREGDATRAAEESAHLADQTKAELLDIATEREIEGRYQMNKAELVDALKES